MTALMPVAPVRDEAAYEAALSEIARAWGSPQGTQQGDRLDLLMILVEAYEKEHHSIGLPDPVKAIKVRMEDLGLSRVELGSMLGVGSGRVSEILTRRRALTLEMIRVLAEKLALPEACLVQPYALEPVASKRTLPMQSRKRPSAKKVTASSSASS